MERSEIRAQLGESKPINPVAFEVVRRTEFVFEPFLGSLIQLPEARMQRTQSSEFFLARSPLEPQTARASFDGLNGERLVWELPLPLSRPSARALFDLSEKLAPFAAEKHKEKNNKTAPDLEPPRFYQPQTVRFFDPVTATGSERDAAEPELAGPRPSIELSPELKAAIMRIDEQRRRMQQEEKPAKDKRRSFLKAKPAKTDFVAEVPVEIVKPREVTLTERAAQWEENSALQPAVVDSSAALGIETQTAALDDVAGDATGNAASAQLAVPIQNPVPVSEVSQPQKLGAPFAHEPVAQDEVVQPGKPVLIEKAFDEPEQAWTSETFPAPAVLEASTLVTPVLQKAISEDATEPIEDDLLPAMFESDSSTTTPVEEDLFVSAQALPPAERLKAMTAAISRVRRADLVLEPVETAIWQAPFVEESWEEERKPQKKKEKRSVAQRMQRWLGRDVARDDGNRRRAERMIMPGLVAFYWSGGIPAPHEILNISRTGFYLKTSELWSLETLVRMTLQRPASEMQRKGESISVLARVVRVDEGGVGHEFVTTEALLNARSMDVMPGHGTDWRQLDRFLHVQ